MRATAAGASARNAGDRAHASITPTSASRECGGSQICEHNSQRSTCKECLGSSICPHKRIRSRCKECGGSQICEHNRRRSGCKSSICPNKRIKSWCEKCGGSSKRGGAAADCDGAPNKRAEPSPQRPKAEPKKPTMRAKPSPQRPKAESKKPATHKATAQRKAPAVMLAYHRIRRATTQMVPLPLPLPPETRRGVCPNVAANLEKLKQQLQAEGGGGFVQAVAERCRDGLVYNPPTGSSTANAEDRATPAEVMETLAQRRFQA